MEGGYAAGIWGGDKEAAPSVPIKKAPKGPIDMM